MGHRRQWIHDHLREQARRFAMDVLAHAVMANHFHVVAVCHPERSAQWSTVDVAERRSALFPLRGTDGAALPADPAEIARRAADPAWVEKHRERLSGVASCIKVMNERIAHRANREDGSIGSFWQGRFSSVALLDQAAVLACVAYGVINPIRVKQADTPEGSATFLGLRKGDAMKGVIEAS